MGGNHPNNQTSEANQWPHHFEMLGQLLFGFIFLIVVAFLYIVRATPARFAREATTPLDDVSQFLALTSPYFPALRHPSTTFPFLALTLPLSAGAPPSYPPDVLPSRQARRAPGADAKQAPRDRSDARRRGRGVGADARETLGAPRRASLLRRAALRVGAVHCLFSSFFSSSFSASSSFTSSPS